MFFFLFENVIKFVNFIDDSDSLTSIGELARFNDPEIFQPSFLLLFGHFFILFEKNVIGRILDSFFDVQGKRDNFKNILFDQTVIIFHVIKESLLITNEIVEFQMIVYFLLFQRPLRRINEGLL